MRAPGLDHKDQHGKDEDISPSKHYRPNLIISVMSLVSKITQRGLIHHLVTEAMVNASVQLVLVQYQHRAVLRLDARRTTTSYVLQSVMQALMRGPIINVYVDRRSWDVPKNQTLNMHVGVVVL